MRNFSASGLLLVLAAVAGCGDDSADDSRRAEEDRMLNAAMQNTPFIGEEIQLPESVNADAADLQANEPVIGVVADGIARAYSIKAMSGMSSHVVNDVIGTTPVSVTYCDRTNCARAFTADTPGQPMSLAVGGFSDDEMLVRYQEQMYKQSSPDIPLTEYECQITTWNAWLEQHPDTKVLITVPSSQEPDDAAVPN
jgi:hypothetical protein